ncbi:hypothetical protein [Cupriavidus consociatus]|uniref:hypothetical protein n=1 Tax=Cupriavidus consociatus TaxID=2821357 RepID=UPI001AE5FDE5|nr:MULTISPECIES: hypothetical protein [unclassified Cupriavidus]MBP0622882.1 hypothetical protein [Cupriavidus sp. LEh25]MDK2659569.1 hypothetical protein [Cupriavidus sp. LEh21]
MRFFAQHSEYDAKTKLRKVIFDFASFEDHRDLVAEMRSEIGERDEGEPAASMLSIEYVADRHQSFRSGSWYDIPPDFFRAMQYESVQPEDQGGAFLRGAIKTRRQLDASPFLTGPLWAHSSERAIDFPKGTTPKIELCVVNCGHANWNEITTPRHRLIYDVGASRSFSSAQVQALVQRMSIGSDKRPITVVISHWDVDHYHAILGFTPADLKKLKNVYAPSQTPNTDTFNRVRKSLQGHGIPLHLVPPAGADATTGRRIVLKAVLRQGRFTAFRATPGGSRNQTGIVIGVEGERRIALLTGDHHYEKILDVARSSYGGKPCVLVAPHHGGRAGKPDAKDWCASFPDIQAVLSCGSNSYLHPIPEVERELRNMQRGQAVWRTDNKGDRTVPL